MTPTVVQTFARGFFSSRTSTAPLFFLLCFLVSATAGASDQNPGLVQEAAGMPCAPTCAICHATAEGGENTANKPFVITMMSNDFRNGDDESIARAIASIDTYNVVTDANRPADPNSGMVPDDVVMLQAGLDPNGLLDTVCGPVYGCGAAHVAPQVENRAALPWGIAALILAFALLLLRRRSLLRRKNASAT